MKNVYRLYHARVPDLLGLSNLSLLGAMACSRVKCDSVDQSLLSSMGADVLSNIDAVGGASRCALMMSLLNGMFSFACFSAKSMRILVSGSLA